MEIREEAVDQILRLLDEFSRKFNVAICLPLLLEDPKFKNHFEQQHAKEYEELCKLCNAAHEDAGAAKNDEPLQVAVYEDHPRRKLRWTGILDALSKHEDDVLSMTRDNEDFRRNYELIVDRVGLLRGIAEHRMKLTPDQLRARKVELRNAEATIIELSERIESLETSYAEETLRYESAMEKSRGEIADLSVTISETEERRGKEFERKIKNCEARLLVLLSDAREDASNAENQLRAHERMLEELTRVHLEQEKLLREQCKATENKRQAARKAYDEDLTALNELRDKLAEQLRSVAASYETLKNEHDALADLHARLKSERELAIMRVFAEQLEHFEKSRAARVIQRTWRAYHQRAQAARKKKKTRRAKS